MEKNSEQKMDDSLIVEKPIYQLYDEEIHHKQICKVCGIEMWNQSIEPHIRQAHPEHITEMWRTKD